MKFFNDKKTLFLFVIFWVLDLGAQNLVVNSSFEDSLYCPKTLGQIDACIGWKSAINTPDYFCCKNPDSGVPSNDWGYQKSGSGNAYAGLIVYSSLSTDQREIIISKLSNSLIKGKKYYVSFKYNRANNTRYATNKLGVTFSTLNITHSNDIHKIVYKNSSKVYSKIINNDTINWKTISGSFIADSSYEYILIGNFFSDSLIEIQEDNSKFSDWSYYYIDDVCVSEDSSLCSNNLNFIAEMDFGKWMIYPNPTEELIYISIPEFDISSKNSITFSVLSMEGKLQYERQFTELNNKNVTLDISELNTGFYQLLVYTSFGFKCFKFLKL